MVRSSQSIFFMAESSISLGDKSERARLKDRKLLRVLFKPRFESFACGFEVEARLLLLALRTRDSPKLQPSHTLSGRVIGSLWHYVVRSRDFLDGSENLFGLG